MINSLNDLREAIRKETPHIFEMERADFLRVMYMFVLSKPCLH